MVRAFTLRAIVLGLLISSGLAWLTPINDWHLLNTPLYNNYNPCIVTALALLLVVLLNPLLGQRRLRSGELAVILGMALAVGGVVSGGLMRRHTAIIAGTAKRSVTESSLAILAEQGADGVARMPLDPRLFLGVTPDHRIDVNDPEYVASVERYFTGISVERPLIEHRSIVTWRDDRGDHTAIAWMATPLARPPPDAVRLDQPEQADFAGLRVGDRSASGAQILAIKAPGIPWDVWWPRLLAWAPLLVGGIIAMIALAGLVRRQWIEHERLTYPIAQLTSELLRDPEPGFRLPPIVRSKAFIIGFALTAGVLTWNGAATCGWVPIEITTHLPLWQLFLGDPWDKVYMWWFFFNLHIWFSVVALTFLMPSDLGFSLWGGWVGLNLGFLLLRLAGVPILPEHAGEASIGGYGAWAVLMLWTGRQWYWPAVKAALCSSTDPITAEGGWWVRMLLLGVSAMIATLMWWGAPIGASIVAVLACLGLFLVLSRIFAEAGIPYFSLPGSFNGALFSLFGVGLPAAAAIPMLSIGFTLLADSREGLMPYATHAAYLGHRANVKPLPLGMWMMAAAVIATVIAGATMLWISYAHNGHPDTYWSGSIIEGALRPIATSAEAVQAGLPGAQRTPWIEWTIGAALIWMVGVARLRWSGFILHPIGLLVCATYPTSRLAFSFFLGWLAKFLVMRYGGQGLYIRLKPVAIGMVAGEAAASVFFIVIVAVAKAVGWSVAAVPEFMPR